jgi:hypothetical protein
VVQRQRLTCHSDHEVGHMLIEAVQEISNNRLDHCMNVFFTRERLDGVKRVPNGSDDYFGSLASGRRSTLALTKPFVNTGSRQFERLHSETRRRSRE